MPRYHSRCLEHIEENIFTVLEATTSEILCAAYWVHLWQAEMETDLTLLVWESVTNQLPRRLKKTDHSQHDAK